MVKKSNLILLSMVLLMFAASAGAEMFFETFDSDPTLGSWTSSTPGDSTFTYNAADDYLDADYVRDTTNVDRYTKALSTTYDRTQEYWWEMDIQMDSTSYFGVKMGSGGVFKSGDDNRTNAMFGEYGYSGATKRIDWHLYKSNSSGRYKVAAETDDDAILRIKGHYWWNGTLNRGYVAMDVYDIPTDTLVAGTGDQYIVTSTEYVSYNLFGLANTYGSNQGEGRSLMAKIDNLYFSTEGANANPVDPGFIPEPATIFLLGMGCALVRYRRKR